VATIRKSRDRGGSRCRIPLIGSRSAGGWVLALLLHLSARNAHPVPGERSPTLGQPAKLAYPYFLFLGIFPPASVFLKTWTHAGDQFGQATAPGPVAADAGDHQILRAAGETLPSAASGVAPGAAWKKPTAEAVGE
jgi:hypothetical protein